MCEAADDENGTSKSAARFAADGSPEEEARSNEAEDTFNKAGGQSYEGNLRSSTGLRLSAIQQKVFLVRP